MEKIPQTPRKAYSKLAKYLTLLIGLLILIVGLLLIFIAIGSLVAEYTKFLYTQPESADFSDFITPLYEFILIISGFICCIIGAPIFGLGLAMDTRKRLLKWYPYYSVCPKCKTIVDTRISNECPNCKNILEDNNIENQKSNKNLLHCSDEVNNLQIFENESNSRNENISTDKIEIGEYPKNED